MEIRVQFPRERSRPTGAVRPAAHRPVDPGAPANDRRQNDRREDDGREPQPSPDADIGGHVDKTA